MTNENLLSRRAVLRGTAALTIPLPLMALAKPEGSAPDARLLTLWLQYQDQTDITIKGQETFDQAYFEARRQYPDRPAMFERIGVYDGQSKTLVHDKIKQFHEWLLPHLGPDAALKRIESDCKTYDQWHGKLSTINNNFQLDKLGLRARTEWAKLHDIEKAITVETATTALGLLVKLERATFDMFSPDTEPAGTERMFFSLLHDVKQLGATDPTAQPLLAAISDRIKEHA